MQLPSGKWGHAIALVLLIILPLLFFWEMIVDAEVPLAADTQAARALGEWAHAARAERGETPLWCPMIFSGMPSYGSFIHTPSSPFDLTAHLRHLASNRGTRYYLMGLIGALALYLLLALRRRPPAAALIGTLIYIMTPYFIGLVAVGHSTKLHALYLAPLVFLGLELLLRRRTAAAAGLLALGIAFQLWNNHPQISYYTLLLGGLYALLTLIIERPQGWRGRGLVAGLLLGGVALVLAAGLVLEPYGGVLEYTPHSIRGAPSALAEAGSAQSGAGWEYATAWSFPLPELITFLFPHWFGLKAPTYWGSLPFTQTTHYVGAAALVLAAFGFVRGGRRRWIAGGLIAFILLVGFGRHLPVLYGPMFHFLPMFSRFRVPSMIYAFLPLFIAFLAADGINALLAPARTGAPHERREQLGGKSPRRQHSRGGWRSWWSPWLWPLPLLLLWLLLGPVVVSGAGDFLKAGEAERYGAATLGQLSAMRADLLRQSIALGLIFLTAAGAVIALRRQGRIPPLLAAGLMLVLVGVDLYVIDRQFYDPLPRRQTEAHLERDGVVAYLESSQQPFRIAPLTRTDFQSNRFAAFGLESINGYQPAKLRIYDDLIQAGGLWSPHIFSMLNAHYVLHEQSLAGQGLRLLHETTDHAGRPVMIHQNPRVLPRAWFVSEARTAPTARALMDAILTPEFDPRRTAWFLEAEVGSLPDSLSAGRVLLGGEDDRVVELKLEDPEHYILTVEVEGPHPGLLVLSEIYYAPGWVATLDAPLDDWPETGFVQALRELAGARPAPPRGALPLRRANYVLRSLLIPPGRHRIEMRAVSPGLERGRAVSQAAAGGVGLLFVLGVVAHLRGRCRQSES